MAFTSEIRKYKLFHLGHLLEYHDCRLNFKRSAKAMEPDATVDLTANNPILQKSNMEIEILVGDEDNATILHVRDTRNGIVIKHSDKNHVGEQVAYGLFKL